jgi:hypothetical protein
MWLIVITGPVDSNDERASQTISELCAPSLNASLIEREIQDVNLHGHSQKTDNSCHRQ